jgi:hypothetical protein
VAEPPDWPLEQSAQGTLRPFHYTAVGYLAVLFQDPEEALGAQRGLQQQGVPEGDLRLYDGEEILRIASRLQQERSILAKVINEVVVDHQLRERWLANARAGGAQLWVQAPTKDVVGAAMGPMATARGGGLCGQRRQRTAPEAGWRTSRRRRWPRSPPQAKGTTPGR